jgi:cyclase
MANVRIIPRLDIKGPNLVKGIHLECLRVLGRPEHFARYYYEHGADEIFYMDIVASLYDRNSLHEIISNTAKEIFVPLTVGGGMRSITDIREVLRAGADKVSINTAAIKNPQLIREASETFGSSTIVATIEAIRQSDGRYLAYTDCGRNYTGVEVFEWAQRLEELGAGEIMLTSVDHEGAGNNFDIELTRHVADAVAIPVIAHGGAGALEHIHDVIVDGHADAVALSSIVHYDYIRFHKDLSGYEDEGNIEFLKKGGQFTRVTPASLKEIKAYLAERGVACRHMVDSGQETDGR